MKNTIPMIIAVVLAAAAVFAVSRMIKPKTEDGERRMVAVVAAAKPIAAGDEIRDTMLKMRHVELSSIPARAIPWDQKNRVIGHKPTRSVAEGDYVLLEDDPYDEASFQDGVGAYPSVTVTVAVSNDFAASNPDFCEFLKHFQMTSPIISEALAYMQDTGADYEAAARWLLTETHPELLETWQLTPEQTEAVKAAL